jgi:hypothetical protein
MSITTVRCPVLGSNVIRVVDFEGTVNRVICPEYQMREGTCRLKSTAAKGGPLSRLIERRDEETLAEHGIACGLR